MMLKGKNELKSSNTLLMQEIEALKKQVEDNALKITAQDHYSRNKNAEIKEIPVTKNENLTDIPGKVSDMLGEPIKEEDVEVCHCEHCCGFQQQRKTGCGCREGKKDKVHDRRPRILPHSSSVCELTLLPATEGTTRGSYKKEKKKKMG